MADTVGISDNSLATTRLINSGFGPQVFRNSGTDSSYSLDPTDTQDFYRLRLSRRSSVITTLSNLSTNADLEFYDSSGVLQSSSNAGTLSDTITTTPLNAGDYYIRVYLQDPTATTNYTLTVNTINDTRADLLWRNSVTGQNVAWLMNGPSYASAAYATTVSDPSWNIQATGDMNGDGNPDYIWRNSATGQNAIWLMNGTTYLSGQFLPTVTGNWTIQGVGDFSGDGNNDIVWRNTTTGENALWFMNGTSYGSTFFLPTIADTNWQIYAVGKFGNDSSPDLLWRNSVTGQNLFWLMDGTSLTSQVTLTTVPDVNWRIVGAGDMNGDGQLDVVWRNSVSGQIVAWYLNGLTSMSFTTISTVADMNWRIASVVNTNGTVDLAGNTMGTALDLGSLNLTLSSGTITGNYGDTISGSDSNDYYQINLANATSLVTTLGGLSPSVNANLSLIQDTNRNGFLDPGEILQQTSTQSSGGASLTQQLSAGTYFIRISSSSPLNTPYQLALRGASAQQIDLLPDNLSTTTPPLTLAGSNGSTLPTSINISTAQTVRVNYRAISSPFSVANATQFRISFYLSRDNVITTSDRLLGTVDPNTGFSSADVVINSLAPYNSTNRTPIISGNFNITLPTATDPWWGGDQAYYIGMIIDSANQVAESNELNNTASAAINITGTLRPDVLGGGLSLVSLAGTPAVFQPGQTIRAIGNIRNIGNVATTTQLPVQFYISNSDLIDPTDSNNTKLLGSAYIGTIASKGSTAFDSINTQPSSGNYFVNTLILPDRTWTGWKGNGRYYIGMQLNPFLNLIQESDGGQENNMNYGRVIGQYIDYNFFDIMSF